MQARGFGCSPVAGLLRWLAHDQQPSPRPRRTAPSPTRTTPSPAMALTTPRATQRAPRQKRICVPPWRTMAASCNWVPSSSSNRIGQGSSAKARPRKGPGVFVTDTRTSIRLPLAASRVPERRPMHVRDQQSDRRRSRFQLRSAPVARSRPSFAALPSESWRET